MGSKVQGFKVASSSLDCIWDPYQRENRQLRQAKTKFRTKLAII